MASKRASHGLAIGIALVGTLVISGVLTVSGLQTQATSSATRHRASAWSTRNLTGNVRLDGIVPLSVSTGSAHLVGRHDPSDRISLSFTLPLHDQAGLDRLIAREAKTHRYLSRRQLYDRFVPPPAQYDALRGWLQDRGFTVTHLGADRLAVAASAPTSVVERALHVRINDYTRGVTSYHGYTVPDYAFYSNTTPPTIPARLGIQAISGLSDVDRFYTNVQLAQAARTGTLAPVDCEPIDQGPLAQGSPLCTDVRAGGYFPVDLRGLYDVAGHGFDGTGQTIGFTLWTAPERQAALTAFATNTGDQLITVDPSCVASGNSPITPSSCATQTVAGDHLLSILENGNIDPGTNYGSNVETALDVEAAHAVATHVGMKYYASECHTSPNAGSGLSNAGCNGTDVGMEMAMEDAANDPTLHSVSNSWGYGGDAEWGVTDPFVVAIESELALGAAAGTSFYFSTGDTGTYESGFPTDSPYVVSVGGTSTYSTSSPAVWSTSVTWSGSGSWCTNLFARPAWQTGAGVAANAPCPGRVSPDVSAISDPNTGVRFTSSTNATGGTQSGQVGGTSLAAPVMNGLQAVTQNFVNAQTYPGATPAIGFLSPMLYQLGNSPNSNSYYRDVTCGNTANPTAGPDGDPALTGWDAATGWGEPDWYNFSIGVAQQLGATSLSTPPSLATNFNWSCAKTPSNSTERAFSCPSVSVCYAVGTASGATPWYGKFLAAGAWGAVNTFFKSTDGGQTWFPSNSDMFSITCLNSATCIEVGAGGRERRTTDGGSTWTDVATAPGNTKPLTQIQCPSSSICYAAGDRGNLMKSTDGGLTWSWLSMTYGNPIYGLSCPTTTVCYTSDIYAHILKTTDGGANWTPQSTPVTTPGIDQVAETGGPNPFAGLMSVSCSDVNTCVATGIYATVSGQTPAGGTDPPVVTTTDGGANWTRQASNAGTGSFLHSVTCLPGTTTCFAVGRGGRITTTTDLVTWTQMTSNTTNMLNSVYCSSATFCIAVGQNGTVDVYNGTTWTATTGNGGTGMLASVTCDGGNLVCYATGKQGITLLTTTGGTSWTIQAGGGTTQQMNGISCPTASLCYAAGNSGTLLKTSNGGQSWLPLTSGTTNALNGIACASPAACVAVGAAGTARFTTDGSTWNGGSTGTTNALNGVSCPSASVCVAVGAAGTGRTSADGGNTWAASSTGTTNALNAVACPTASTCYSAGAAGTIVMSTNGGANFSTQTSGTTATLNGIACVNDSNCFVDGTTGLTSSTVNGGTNWSQQGNPTSGPVTALNATSITLNGSLCTSSRCMLGTGVQGDILTTPLLTVTVNTAQQYGTTPALSGLAANNAAISYNPAAQAANVTGTLTCSTTATNTSDPGSFPISNCSGLSDNGFSIVYDYANSAYTVTTADQTINFAALADKTYGDPDFTLGATATSGLTVSFTVGATDQCTMADATTVHITGAGSCTVTAHQPGNIDYNVAPDVPQTFTIHRADQTIDFNVADHTFGDPDFTISATATSGLTVTFGIDSGQCTLTPPDTVHITGGGSCTIRASQAGDSNYNAATDVVRTLTINKASQSIDFAAIPDHTYLDPNIALGATATSGLTVTYDAVGNCSMADATHVSIDGAGSCTVTAHQTGDSNYNPASDVARAFDIAKADQLITFPPIGAQDYGSPNFDLPANAMSGAHTALAIQYTSSGQCTVSANHVTLTGAGSCSITAHQPGDANFNPAADVGPNTFTIAPATTASTVHASPSPDQYSDPVTLTATVTTGGGQANGTAEYFVNGVSKGTAPVVNGASTLAAAQQLKPSGPAYSLKVVFTSSDTDHLDSTSPLGSLTVSPEDARASLQASQLVFTANTSTGSATVAITATVLDISAVPGDPATDATPGNISKALVTFVNRGSNRAIKGCKALPVSPLNLTAGTASCTAALNTKGISGLGVGVYDIGVDVKGYYRRSAPSEDIVVTVAKPYTSLFAAGGGALSTASSAGSHAGTAGTLAQFGFGTRTVSGNRLSLTTLLIQSGGHIYKVRSSSASTFTDSAPDATISGPATITDVTNPASPVVVDGAATVKTLAHNGTGGGQDLAGFEVRDHTNALFFSSDWNGSNTITQGLTAGGIRVR